MKAESRQKEREEVAFGQASILLPTINRNRQCTGKEGEMQDA